jgi:CubicO group peptidase (beta-lactamase class C family)
LALVTAPGALLLSSPEDPAAAPAAEELAGLWAAKRRFGPDARGALLIRRTGASHTAEMMGRLVPVRRETGELSFELPDGQGAFRGRFEDDGRRIRGHWVRPGTLVNGDRSLSPVLLETDGADRWRGLVAPSEDDFTFYLLAQSRPDGSLGVVLRNPERDFGTQIGARRMVREGNALTLLGQRPGQEQRELARGAYDPENRVFTLTFPSRGGTYDFAPAGDESDFYPRGRNPGRYTYVPPPALEDGWPAGTLEAADIDRAGMESLIQRILETPMGSADAPQIHAILVARHGRLVLEEYFHGFHRDRLHDTRSAAKSLTAIVVGAAIEAGTPLDLSSRVYAVMSGGALPADLERQKRDMTLEHLLTMSPGWFCDDTDEEAPGNEENIYNQEEEPDWYRYTLAVPMAALPGERSVYCSASANLALGMVGRATGEMPVYAFDRWVAAPLRIRRYAWPLDPAGNAYGGGGVNLLPRDFLKLGQLMLDGGTWEGRRVLAAGFAAQATTPQYRLRNLLYGYLWWIEDYPYKSRTVRSFSARGNGGQTVTVVPELALVFATMAGNYSSRVQLTHTGTLLPRFVLPAVREPGDDPGAPVVEREFTSPYGRSADGSRVAPPGR